MDLNLQYFEHQKSLIRAGAASTRLERIRHLASAGVTANRIMNYQMVVGANAASDWARATEASDRRNAIRSGAAT